MLVDGHFQLETAMKQLTNATSEDSTLTKRIQYAISACNELFLNCPLQYWTASDECNQRTLNNCPHFLVHTDTF
uniref:Uncharacterized protein n=1 Tax=Anopheles merus TaxID=30066 RepID=A0A9I3MJE9_ANOME